MPSYLTPELEARLLVAAPDIEAFSRLREEQGEAWEHWGALYLYIQEFSDRYHILPSVEDLEATFALPSNCSRGEGIFEALLVEIRQVRMARAIQDTVERAVLQSGAEPQRMLSRLIADLSAIQPKEQRYASRTDATMLDRMRRYEQMEATTRGMVSGVPTGLSYFDTRYGLGWQPSELIGVVGRTYTGKTFLLLYFGIIAWQSGRRVLLLSPELDQQEVEARFDALLLARAGLKVSLTELYRGLRVSEAMRLAAKTYSARADWLTVVSGESASLQLSDVLYYAHQHRSELILIDGLSLLSVEKGRQVWESMRDLCYGLKGAAVRLGTPIILAHQANRSAHNTARPPALHEVSFGDALAQACDRVLSIAVPTAQENTIRVAVQKFRRGRTNALGVELHFAPEEGKIYERDPGSVVGDWDSRDGSLPGAADPGGLSLP